MSRAGLTPTQFATACGVFGIVTSYYPVKAPDRLQFGVSLAVFVESSYRNLNRGDQPDVYGLLQQGKFYGTPEQRLDPAVEVDMFLMGGPNKGDNPAFLDQPYEKGTLVNVARCVQNVQRSQNNGDPGFPFAQNYIDQIVFVTAVLTEVKAAFYGRIAAQNEVINVNLTAQLQSLSTVNRARSAILNASKLNLAPL